MAQPISASWVRFGCLGLAVSGCCVIASSFLLGDKTLAQQAPAKTSPAKRFDFSAGKKPKTKPKRKNKASARARPQIRRLAVPKPETLLALIRLYLVGLDQAIKANNFSVLHAISAPHIKSKMSVKQLATAFEDFRALSIDLTRVVITTPQITESPKILPGNILNIVGHFPATRDRINFHMQFQPADRRWRLRGMKIDSQPIQRAKPTAKKKPAKKAKQTKKKVK